MSLLKYFSKAPHGEVSEAAVSDHDASADLPSEAESDESTSSLVTVSGCGVCKIMSVLCHCLCILYCA